MLSPRWRKVLRDLWGNKTRSLLVVLSIAVGVFAVGTVAHMRAIVSRDLDASYAAVNPANATIYTSDTFDEQLVETIRRMDIVQDAEGRRSSMVRFKLGPADEWHPMELFALPDYENIHVNKVRQEIVFGPDPANWPQGAWPPPDRSLVLERTSLLMSQLGLVRAKLGDTLLVETATGKQRSLPIVGLAYDFSRIPATFMGRAYAFVTPETMAWLGEARDFSELHVVFKGSLASQDAIQPLADLVADKVEKSGHPVLRTQTYEPGRLPLDNYFQAISVILGTLGVFSLLLSGFLLINTISALLAQQVKQIGIMKAIGARSGQITAMYLSMVMVFGLLALAIAVPLGTAGAREFVNFLAYFLNFQLTAFRVPPSVVALEAAMALLVPVAAAVWPILAGTRISVRQAISDYGLNAPRAGRGLFRVPLPRPLLLSLRNTFRRRARLVLTLITLTLASTVFVSVFSVRESLALTYDVLLQYWQYDVQVQLERPQRIANIEHAALQVPGVERAEVWDDTAGYRVAADGREGRLIGMTALPAATQLFRPSLVAGRWLLPDDENALVISADVLREEPDLKVGDTVVFNVAGRDMTWQVVGVIRGFLSVPVMYINYPYYARTAGNVGRGAGVRVITAQHDSAFQDRVAADLQDRFAAAGMDTIYSRTNAQQREQAGVLFDILFQFLMSMSVLLAAVGGLGLMGTMSLNVLERTREIGVMRAIGASDNAVLQVIAGEGVLIGLLSWLAGVLLALPVGYLLAQAVGLQFLRVPLTYRYSLNGALLWLGLAIGLALLASYMPAQRATQLTVRDVLAYE